jgi:hypothetical protein
MKYLIAIALFLATSLQGMSQSVIVQSTKVLIHGTSTLHDWTSEAEKAIVNLEVLTEGGNLTGINSTKVTIPVKSIISEKGSMMDKKTWAALKESKNPNITFVLGNVSPITSTGTVSASGTLTIAGKAKAVSLSAKLKSLGNGVYEISGTHPIKMTDYDMDPPTALMGTIKVGEDVKVEYTVRFYVKS